MSGGYFIYKQYHINDIANQIKDYINSDRAEDLSDNTLKKFNEAIHTLEVAAIMAQRIDWLISCDDGEESFNRRWDMELSKLTKDKEE